MDLLIFFALPLATIIVSAILQRLLKNPLAVVALVFAIFVIVTFAAFDETFLIATLAYTILAFITAFIVKFLFCSEDNKDNDDDCKENLCTALINYLESNTQNSNNDSLTDILSNNDDNDNATCNCGCGCNRRYRRF